MFAPSRRTRSKPFGPALAEMGIDALSAFTAIPALVSRNAPRSSATQSLAKFDVPIAILCAVQSGQGSREIAGQRRGSQFVDADSRAKQCIACRLRQMTPSAAGRRESQLRAAVQQSRDLARFQLAPQTEFPAASSNSSFCGEDWWA